MSARASAYERLLDALHEHGSTVKANGVSAVAQCPAHGDRNPSLSVRPIEGQTLVYCHGGCDTVDVLGVLNLAMRDLYDNPAGARYDYRDAAGKVLRTVHRSPQKDFRQSGDTKGTAPLYRLSAVTQAVQDGTTVYVCEGEKDVHAVESLGAVATTSPMGASNAHRADWSPLHGAHVVLVPDRDQAGKRYASDVLALLDGLAASVRVALPKAGKDAADHVAAGHGLEELVPVELPAAEDDADAGTLRQSGGKKAAATVLVELALARYRLGVAEGGEPFAVAHKLPHLARLLRGQGSLRAELAGAYYSATGKAAPQQALADALLVLEGEALHDAPERLYLRVAEAGGALWVDLGDVAATVVQVTATGWRVAESVPVLFHRTALTGVLPTPADRGDLAALWRLVNVSPEHRPVLAACLVAALFPDLAHPVVALLGEQGTGKTTASRLLAGVLDPSPAQTRKAPRDVEGWVTAAAGSWLVALDNLSTIQDWLSDALCRAVTGDADVRRRLYTDADLTIFAFRRVVIVNGIDLGAIRDDLADRLVAVQLTPIGERDRLLDADLARAWQVEHPAILAGLLDLASTVLRRLPTIRLAGLPRMADYARVLAAVDAELGTDGLATYLGLRAELAEDAVAADPVLARLASTVRGEWAGTAAELLDHLTPTEPGWKPGREWPSSARSMTGLLRRRAPSLRRVGWTVDDLGRQGKANAVRFRIRPPEQSDGRRATGERQASEASDDARQASDRNPRRSPQNPPVTCEDAESAEKASDASDDSYLPLLSRRGEEEGEPPDTPPAEGAQSSLASLATLASDADDLNCPDCGRDLDADPAPACAYRLHTQGVLR